MKRTNFIILKIICKVLMLSFHMIMKYLNSYIMKNKYISIIISKAAYKCVVNSCINN